MENVRIQLFFLHLPVNSRTAWALKLWLGSRSRRTQTLAKLMMSSFKSYNQFYTSSAVTTKPTDRMSKEELFSHPSVLFW